MIISLDVALIKNIPLSHFHCTEIITHVKFNHSIRIVQGEVRTYTIYCKTPTGRELSKSRDMDL